MRWSKCALRRALPTTPARPPTARRSPRLASPRLVRPPQIAECHPSIVDVLNDDPQFAVWKLTRRTASDGASEIVFEENCPGAVPDGFTAFVTTSSAASATLTRFSAVTAGSPWYRILNGDATTTLTTPNGTACAPAWISSPQSNAVALMNQLPQGGYSADQLLALGSAPTGLSLAFNDSAYDLDFRLAPDGRVCADPRTPGGTSICITDSFFMCDGVIHATDEVLLPSEDPAKMPGTLATMYDLPHAQLEAAAAAAAPPRNCSGSLLDVLDTAPDLRLAAAQVRAADDPALLAALDDPATSATLFVATDEAYRRAGVDPRNATAVDARAAVYTALLPRAYCARELQQVRVVSSLAADASGADLPAWAFTTEPSTGAVRVQLQSVDNRAETAGVVRTERTCGSIVFVDDRYLGAVGEAAVSDATAAAGLALLRVGRPLSMDVVCPNATAAAAPPPSSGDGGGGLSAGAIAGIAVGVVGLAAAAVVAVALARRRRRRARGPAAGLLALEAADGEGGSHFLALAAASASGSSGATGSGATRSSSGGAPSPWDIKPAALQLSAGKDGGPVELGRGGFGIVYKGMLNGVQPVAVKLLRHPGAEAREAFFREVAIMQHVSRDRNVVQFCGVSTVGDQIVIVSELMEGGDLRAALAGPRGAELAWAARGQALALDIARGLCFLHGASVVHRDLKSRNVLLSADWGTAKIADVGTAAITDAEGYLTQGAGQMIGTLAWAAPELLLGDRVSPAADIYSFGILLWEIVTRETPKRGFTPAPEPGEACPAELAALIEACRAGDPKARPSAREAYERLLACPPAGGGAAA